jgi:hypothetical protein
LQSTAQVCFGFAFARQFADLTVDHQHDSVGRGNNFVELRGNQQYSDSFIRDFPDDLPHLDFGVQINSCRRLVQNEYLRVGGKPFGKDDLLLVASAELGRLLIAVTASDRQPLLEPRKKFPNLQSRNELAFSSKQALETRQGENLQSLARGIVLIVAVFVTIDRTKIGIIK